MKKCFTTVSVMLVLLSIESCKCTGDSDIERHFLMGFDLFDKDTNKNLLGLSGVYRLDSVTIYDDSNSIVYPGPVPLDGSVYFSRYFDMFKEIHVGTDVTEYYYLYLRNGTLDIDTFKLEYRAFIGDCNEKELTYLNFYYNEQLVFESQNPRNGFDIDLFK
ncbi:MAG: hypothetical protein ABJN36_00550 [Cyclobacteriaceae bacterium]